MSKLCRKTFIPLPWKEDWPLPHWKFLQMIWPLKASPPPASGISNPICSSVEGWIFFWKLYIWIRQEIQARSNFLKGLKKITRDVWSLYTWSFTFLI